MYFLSNSKTGTARFTEEETTVFNEILLKYQQEKKVVFESFKDAVYSVFTHVLDAENKAEKDVSEVIKVDVIKADCATYSAKHDLPIEFTALQIVKDALTAERIKEVEVKETPVSLKENEILIDFDAEQLETLQVINKNRTKELVKLKYPEEAIEDTIKGMLFNSSTLGDWSSEFYTGLD